MCPILGADCLRLPREEADESVCPTPVNRLVRLCAAIFSQLPVPRIPPAILADYRYFVSRKRQALATSLTPSNVPLQLMYQFSFRSSSELGLLFPWVP